MGATEYLTVTALTKYIKAKFDRDPYLDRVYLTGEISNFRVRPGHQYFRLKDDHAVIGATMWQGNFKKLTFKPEEGMKVLVIGRVQVYEPSGSYSIIIEHMEPDGVGALFQALKQMQEKLQKEGLFNPQFKQAIPRYPKRIAVLTSPSGAVIRDIITTVRRRYPIAQIVLFPTKVQGEGSAEDVVRNIRRVEENGTFDTMIIGRGGGSIEDLWSFNDERVVRAIFEAKTPTISSVGHETDTTLADLVADQRAATPTAAAELATPVLLDEIERLRMMQNRLMNLMQDKINVLNKDLLKLRESYFFLHPERLYDGLERRLDELTTKLIHQTEQKIQLFEKQKQEIAQRLELCNPINQVKQYAQKREHLASSLANAMQQYMTSKDKQMRKAIDALDLVSPLKIMSRGYAYSKKDGHVVKSVKEIQLKDQLDLIYADGEVLVEVKKIEQGE